MEFLKAVNQEAFHHETPARLSTSIFDRLHAAEGSSSLYILWGFFAFAALSAAVAICFTPGADRRISTAMSTAPDYRDGQSPGLSRLDAARAAEMSPEELLLARLQALENQVGTITTGSIEPAPPPEPEVIPGVTPPANREVHTAAAPAAPADVQTEPPVTRTQFGIDLGSEPSFGSLRIRWDNLRRKYPELSRLSPRISVRDNKGKVELRLVAGPFDNAAEAAKACAGLLAKGAVCDGGLFDGQHLPQS